MRVLLQLATLLLLGSTVAAQSAVLDRVVVTVDRRVIMASDVDTEARLAKLLAGTPDAPIGAAEKQAALERLITTKLALPRIRGEYTVAPDSPEVVKQLQQTREDCHLSPPEWQALLGRFSLSDEDIAERLSEELTIARYIDMRFRSTVVVAPEEVENYFNTIFVTQVQARGAAPPKLKEVSPQIEQILTEQKANELFATWVDGLRTQSSIRSLDPAYAVEIKKSTAPQIDSRYLPLRISDQPGKPEGATTEPKASPHR